MKLHRIEVHNLNSLYGPYEDHTVDLDRDLPGASLFLVHGPTGSGKSTLMDAVSLALFGQTPRLDGRSTQGGDNGDPRNIMSRGTGTCGARLTFSKIEDGRRVRYRATWACHRAHKRPDGNFTPVVRSLERLEDAEWALLVSAKKKRDYEPRFDEVLEGFSVEDFGRSMLLAQGQFDAFLSAAGDDRARILERLTNTSIYRGIGARAARMWRVHKDLQAKLEVQIATSGGLSDDELAELNENHKTNEAAHTQATAEVVRVDGQLTWLTQSVELTQKLTEATEGLAALSAERELHRPEQDALEEHDRCHKAGAFTHLDALGEQRQQHADATHKIEETTRALDEARRSEQSSQLKLQKLDDALQRNQRHLEALRPLDEAARSTRKALDTAEAYLQGRARKHQEAAKAAANQAEKAEKAAGQAQQLAAQAADAKAELEARGDDARLAEAWSEERAALVALATRSDQHGAAGDALTERDAELNAERERLSRDTEAHERQSSEEIAPKKKAADEARARLSDRLGDHALDDRQATLSAEIDAQRGKREHLTGAIQRLEAIVGAQSELDAQRTRTEQLTEDHDEAMKAASKAAERASQLELRSREAQEQHRSLERVAQYAQDRQRLTDHEACPLCGAPEHPYRHDPARVEADANIEAELHRSRTNADSVQRSAEEARRESEEASARSRAQAALQKQAREDLDARSTALTDKRAQNEALLMEAELPTDLTLDEATSRHEATAAAIREREDEQEALRGLKTAQDTAAEALRTLEDQLQQRQVDLQRRQAAYAAQAAQLTADREGHGAAADKLSKDLEAATNRLSAYGLAPEEATPSGWIQAGDGRVAEHHARDTSAKDLARKAETQALAAQSIEEQTKVLAKQAETLGEESAAAQAKRDEAAKRRDQSQLELTTTWAGFWTETSDDVDPVSDELLQTSPADMLDAQDARVRGLTEQLNAVRADHQAAREQCTASQSTLDAQTELQSRLQSQIDETSQALKGALDDLDLPDAETLATRRLSDPQRKVASDRRDDLARRSTELATRRDERTKALEQHEQARPEGLDEQPSTEEVRARLDASKAAAEATKVALATTAKELFAHEKAARDQAGYRAKLEAARSQGQVWEELNKVIGVKEGAEFQRFAQSLNLQGLLDRANVHLDRLNKRFRLIPRLDEGRPTLNFDLEDRDQLGQTTSPRSLSGGERFLVSLSLALGLSDFRQVSMPIETLLLDEGFGTLDPETLDTALAALSQLQADGRQVGIISHVVGLEDKIPAQVRVRKLGGGRSNITVG